jgi:hypothetical protein
MLGKLCLEITTWKNKLLCKPQQSILHTIKSDFQIPSYGDQEIVKAALIESEGTLM